MGLDVCRTGMVGNRSVNDCDIRTIHRDMKIEIINGYGIRFNSNSLCPKTSSPHTERTCPSSNVQKCGIGSNKAIYNVKRFLFPGTVLKLSPKRIFTFGWFADDPMRSASCDLTHCLSFNMKHCMTENSVRIR